MPKRYIQRRDRRFELPSAGTNRPKERDRPTLAPLTPAPRQAGAFLSGTPPTLGECRHRILARLARQLMHDIDQGGAGGPFSRMIENLCYEPGS